MTEAVFRYSMEITDRPEVHLPAGARVLSVGPPRDMQMAIDMWVLVDPQSPMLPRRFQIVGTGNPVPDNLGRFIGTVPTHGGQLIWHVFEG